MQQELRYKIFNILEKNSSISQRQLAKELGVSLGKTNYCLRALIEKGLVKAGNIKRSNNKKSYLYLLTPKGIEEKGRLAIEFLERKIQEHKELTIEIEKIRVEVEKLR